MRPTVVTEGASLSGKAPFLWISRPPSCCFSAILRDTVSKIPKGVLKEQGVCAMLLLTRDYFFGLSVTHLFRTTCLAFVAVLLFVFLPALTSFGEDDTRDPTMRPEAPMNERVLRVPGDPERPVMLEVTLYTPHGAGPFPLAVMNHGAFGDKSPRLNPRYRFTYSAYYFLSRGYAVALPMMRGFAGSGGNVEHHGCDLTALGVGNAKDIRAVIEYLRAQPYIDGDRVVMAGQSFGGWNTLAFGTLNYPRVKGLVNFVGGVKPSDCTAPERAMAFAAEYFGSHTRTPSIWFYGDNDKVFSVSAWRTLYDRYTASEGKAELVAIGKFMDDSHNMLGFPESLAIWGPKVDAFLEKVGLPNKVVYPEYLPTPFPPSSNYAKIDDIDAVPYLSDQGRQLYQRFLKKAMPRVLVLAPNGGWTSSGGLDPVGKALADCHKQSSICQLYAVDDYVVWTRPTPAPAPTHFASLQDQTAIPFINEVARRTYQERFLTARKPRAFVIAPDGAWSLSAGGADPLATAMETCSKTHTRCQFYAVDNDIVWPEQQQ